MVSLRYPQPSDTMTHDISAVHFANSAHLLDMLTQAKVRGFRFRMFTDRFVYSLVALDNQANLLITVTMVFGNEVLIVSYMSG